MVRSAAKNHRDVAIVCNPARYGDVLRELREGGGELSEKTRRELALSLGATSARDAASGGLASLEAGSFHHAIISSAGAAQAEEAMRFLRPGGSLLLFSGNAHGLTAAFDMNEIHYRQLHIHGSIDCTITQFHHAAALLPRLRMEKLVSGVYPLSRTREAFFASKAPDAVKLLIDGRSE